MRTAGTRSCSRLHQAHLIPLLMALRCVKQPASRQQRLTCNNVFPGKNHNRRHHHRPPDTPTCPLSFFHRCDGNATQQVDAAAATGALEVDFRVAPVLLTHLFTFALSRPKRHHRVRPRCVFRVKVKRVRTCLETPCDDQERVRRMGGFHGFTGVERFPIEPLESSWVNAMNVSFRADATKRVEPRHQKAPKVWQELAG